MRIKEAVKYIEELICSEEYINTYGGSSNEPMSIALDMAIEALEKRLQATIMEIYPYNMAERIFGCAEEARTLSIEGIETGLATLTDRERRVLRLRFEYKMTLEQAGKELGVTRERIRQIEAKGLRKLRHPTRIAKMKAYSYYDLLKRAEENNLLIKENKRLEKIIELYIDKKPSDEELEIKEQLANRHNINIGELDFSVRVWNSLYRSNINTLGEITEMTERELSRIRNLGRKSVEEIKKVLENHGLKLKA